MNAGPPHPIPPYLQPPGDVPLGDGDLVIVATRDELYAITEAASDQGFDPSFLRIVHRDGSPWIEFSAVKINHRARVWNDRLPAEATGRTGHFALWRYTLAVYRIGSDGAVEDDPVWTPEL